MSTRCPARFTTERLQREIAKTQQRLAERYWKPDVEILEMMQRELTARQILAKTKEELGPDVPDEITGGGVVSAPFNRREKP